jgi:hypothetical protein
MDNFQNESHVYSYSFTERMCVNGILCYISISDMMFKLVKFGHSLVF